MARRNILLRRCQKLLCPTVSERPLCSGENNFNPLPRKRNSVCNVLWPHSMVHSWADDRAYEQQSLFIDPLMCFLYGTALSPSSQRVPKERSKQTDAYK